MGTEEAEEEARVGSAEFGEHLLFCTHLTLVGRNLPSPARHPVPGRLPPAFSHLFHLGIPTAGGRGLADVGLSRWEAGAQLLITSKASSLPCFDTYTSQQGMGQRGSGMERVTSKHTWQSSAASDIWWEAPGWRADWHLTD